MLHAFATYLEGTPWALPTIGLAAVSLALSARRIAARTGSPAWLTIGFGLSLAAFLGVTATPGPSGRFDWSGSRYVSWSYHVPTFHELAQIVDPWGASEPALNAWLAMPLGCMAVVAAVTMRSAWPMFIAVVATFAAEGVQWAFPGFGRAAFLFGDVTANWCGGLIGGAIAVVALLMHAGLSRLRSYVLMKRGIGPTSAGIVAVIRRERASR